jgi:hypothetical protein
MSSREETVMRAEWRGVSPSNAAAKVLSGDEDATMPSPLLGQATHH